MIAWETCRKDFRWDGSLRDIYIIPATLDDWRAVFPLFRDYAGAEFSIDGVVRQSPVNVEEAFAVRASGSPMLRFRVGRALVVFHFFSEVEMECAIDPREITSQADLDSLLGFVERLGDAVCKQVLLTPENRQHQPFISYDPHKHAFEYHKSAA